MAHGLIWDGSGQVLSSNVYDSFGVAMDTSGSAQSPYRPTGLLLDEEGLEFSGPPVVCPLYANRALALSEEQCGGGGVVEQGCMTLCEATYGIVCEALELEPALHALCILLVHAFCEKACSSATQRPWPDCARICVQRPDCTDCCNSICQGRGALAECYNACATAPVE